MRTIVRAAVLAAFLALVQTAAANIRLDWDDLPLKNRVGGFCGFTASIPSATCSQPADLHLEIVTTDMTTVSGILYWLTPDPLGEFADPLHNLYRFVGNNPLGNVDPDGLEIYAIQGSYPWGPKLKFFSGEASYYKADRWYEHLVAQPLNMLSLGGNLAWGFVDDALSDPDALMFATWGLAIEAQFVAQGVTILGEAVSQCPTGPETPAVGDRVTRNWGGESGPHGQSWTRDPVSRQSRNSLGLETPNSGEFISSGRLIDDTGVITKPADPWGRFLGGGDEVGVPNAQRQILLDAVTMPDDPLPFDLPMDPRPR